MPPHNRRDAERSEILVHETHRPPAAFLRYIDQVAGDPSTTVEFRYSQGVLTDFDVDVVHVVDRSIDVLLGTKNSSSVRRLLATLLLIRNLRRHEIALVRTIDESKTLEPRGRLAKVIGRILDSATHTFITLDRSTPPPLAGRTVVIPNASYRSRFLGYPRGRQSPGRVLCMASAQLPLTVRGVLPFSRLTAMTDVHLRVVGQASRTVNQVVRRAVTHGLASARLEKLSDGSRVQEIDAAELVVILPSETLEQHQLVLLALSLDRPVLTVRSAAMENLAAEVGPGWVHLSEGAITAEAVDIALVESRRTDRSERPNLDGRDLEATRRAYEKVFREAAAAHRK